MKKVAEYIQKVNRSRSWGRLIGMTLVLCGATLWGVSGNAAQYLFETQKVSAGWLTSVRMLTAGVLLLAIMQCGKHRQQVWAIWKQRRSASSLVVFGLVGMIGSQYTYFEAVAAGNAATATLLQYLSPVLILLFSILFMRKKPKMIELTAMVIALLGVFFLVTKGHPQSIIDCSGRHHLGAAGGAWRRHLRYPAGIHPETVWSGCCGRLGYGDRRGGNEFILSAMDFSWAMVDGGVHWHRFCHPIRDVNRLLFVFSQLELSEAAGDQYAWLR
ncbi:permease of the drug/metabolite transporter (DMT) superfamily [Sporolactobacillus inulinus]|uniref:Permease of the drug/metabolite transporter (DMT) superfamily n=1 Tax=Sporolactobacillus inulinus TaxID=2078 RepID=A0A4Y1ZDA9_9BACL|nr:permease of the drug/metabolite transporter (DMT) superfamily [Sporolactobacillus inulinus]